jgi:hypothetical protein
MTDVLSLGPVLDLIERWQQWPHTTDVLMDIDIPALRALAEQHAAQLRDRVRAFPHTSVDLQAAADFLASK